MMYQLFPIIFYRTQVFGNVDHSRAEKIYTDSKYSQVSAKWLSDKWTSENINLKTCGQMSKFDFGRKDRSNDDDGPYYDDDGVHY